ncbi:hypothetical protein [Streptomyces sp. NPDC054866]
MSEEKGARGFGHHRDVGVGYLGKGFAGGDFLGRMATGQPAPKGGHSAESDGRVRVVQAAAY